MEQIKKLIFARKLRYAKDVTVTSSEAGAATASTKEVMSKMMNELVQYSMSTANDSYQTSLCLQFTPQEIATACVYLACQFAGVEPLNGGSDWKATLGDPDVNVLFSICIQILDLISDKKASDLESVKKIRAALELMRTREGQLQQPERATATRPSGVTRTPPPTPPQTSSTELNPNKRPRVG